MARVGLIDAVERYDPCRGSYTAFAVITVRGELAVTELMHLLPQRVQRMLALRFFGDLTQAPIAAEFTIRGHGDGVGQRRGRQ